MALLRRGMASARGLQSRRRVRFRLSNNEPAERKEVCRKEILLESKDSAYYKNQKKA